MKTIVRTWFRDGTELQSSPCQMYSGFTSVEQLRGELKSRFRNTEDVRDIDGGIEFTPKRERQLDCLYGKMQVYLESQTDASN